MKLDGMGLEKDHGGQNPEMGAVLQTGGLLTGSGQCGLLNSYVYCFYLTSLMVFFN